MEKYEGGLACMWQNASPHHLEKESWGDLYVVLIEGYVRHTKLCPRRSQSALREKRSI